MNIPADLLYTKEHEWILVEEDIATIGITDYAQQELGDVVYVELPEEGQDLESEDEFGSVESVKAVSEIYAPMGGTVTEVNSDLDDNPELVNEDPYGDAWMIRIKFSDKSQLEDLMSAKQYEEFISEEPE
jgi:glycine cleavage system H protein